MRKFFLILMTTLSLSGASAQQGEQKEIGYDDLKEGVFSARGVYGLRSMADGEHFTAITDNREAIVRYGYRDGEALDTIFNSVGKEPSFKILGYSLSEDENLILFPTEVEPRYRHSYTAKYWIYNRLNDELKELSKSGGEQVATFSPDGKKAAYVRENNIYVVDLINGGTKQITSDGESGKIINGHTDWVHEEELGFTRAYQWSPNSDAIAYYRTDESKVKQYYMPVFNGELYPENLSFKYPKAGENNSEVSIKLYNLNSGISEVIDQYDQDNDGYFALIEWTGRRDELALHKVNRAQNKYELVIYNTVLHSAMTVFTESSSRYVDRIDKSKVHFLPEINRFIVLSELEGYRHLYLYDMSGKYITQLTNGEWEVTSLDGVDARSGNIFFTAAKESPLQREPYMVNFKKRGAQPVRLSSAQQSGTYSVDFSKGNRYYIQSFSNTTTPTVTTLHSTRYGTELRTLEDNKAVTENVEKYALPTKKFITVMADDGVTKLNGYMLLPYDFDESKEYPLLMTQYSGPGSQSVSDSWGYGWESALLKEGYLVACVDGRGTGFRGFEFRSCTYNDLGKYEVLDQIAAAKELGALPYVDSERIGIYGWSYGGFMALNCILKGSDVFSTAIAVAPVTSWRYYDTIYTELYNGDPNQNPEGYDQNSPINFADQLEGKLLLVHGTADDNVHIQNSYDMITALNNANKEFEMLIYPDCNHSMGKYRNNLMVKCIDFLKRNL
ncbi:MAG: S9 family peptidase [Rikenellaceae bacterium]